MTLVSKKGSTKPKGDCWKATYNEMRREGKQTNKLSNEVLLVNPVAAVGQEGHIH